MDEPLECKAWLDKDTSGWRLTLQVPSRVAEELSRLAQGQGAVFVHKGRWGEEWSKPGDDKVYIEFGLARYKLVDVTDRPARRPMRARRPK